MLILTVSFVKCLALFTCGMHNSFFSVCILPIFCSSESNVCITFEDFPWANRLKSKFLS